MFTRQHYRAIAKMIKEDGLEHELADLTAAPGAVWSHFAAKLAGYFANDNPLFDHNKFMTTCGF